jgi:hypothetical protein
MFKKEMDIVKLEQAKGLTLERMMMMMMTTTIEYGAAKFKLFLCTFCVSSIALS